MAMTSRPGTTTRPPSMTRTLTSNTRRYSRRCRLHGGVASTRRVAALLVAARLKKAKTPTPIRETLAVQVRRVSTARKPPRRPLPATTREAVEAAAALVRAPVPAAILGRGRVRWRTTRNGRSSRARFASSLRWTRTRARAAASTCSAASASRACSRRRRRRARCVGRSSRRRRSACLRCETASTATPGGWNPAAAGAPPTRLDRRSGMTVLRSGGPRRSGPSSSKLHLERHRDWRRAWRFWKDFNDDSPKAPPDDDSPRPVHLSLLRPEPLAARNWPAEYANEWQPLLRGPT
mmetsp:Transcript_3727/g.13754  ORF Transcript_3727/g.13754 Transcript_3727/m.13754 type:complete len:293 (+) Transcript_3727:799-1677(+)